MTTPGFHPRPVGRLRRRGIGDELRVSPASDDRRGHRLCPRAGRDLRAFLAGGNRPHYPDQPWTDGAAPSDQPGRPRPRHDRRDADRIRDRRHGDARCRRHLSRLPDRPHRADAGLGRDRRPAGGATSPPSAANIVNASPAADLVPVLLALDATGSICAASARHPVRCRSIASWWRRGRTERRPEEILTAVRFDKAAGGGGATWFLKAGRRKAMEISVICVAAHLVSGRQGRGIAIGAAALAHGAPCRRRKALVEKAGRRPPSTRAGRIAADTVDADRRLSDPPRAIASCWWRRWSRARAPRACADRIAKGGS